jgi:hypothetical protein
MNIMADVRVTCIEKPDPDSPHEHITHIGNPAAGWKWPREKVIASIEEKSNTFFVLDPWTGKRSDVGMVRSVGRSPYLRTYADGDWNNNLLSLDQCPL